VSEVSLGTEHLIDLPREHVAGVIHEAIDGGVNYFDVFFAQAEFRENMGAAFAGRRERAYLAVHLGAIDENGQYAKTRDVALAEKFFEDFLMRYKTDHADVLFLHNSDTSEDYEDVMRPGGLLDMAKRHVKEGKARCIGFSGHTTATSLEAVESGEVDVLMFPINLAGNAVAGKKELFAACAARGVGLVGMKPYAGGKLLTGETEIELTMWHLGGEALTLSAAKAKDGAAGGAITAVQCLSYALAQTGVTTVVPGCKDKAELHAALAYAQATEEAKDFSRAVGRFETYVAGECVYCNHCLPCPSAIDIGRVIRLVELARGAPTPETAAVYKAMKANADDCVQCGECRERCPFGVDAPAKMEEAVRVFKAK